MKEASNSLCSIGHTINNPEDTILVSLANMNNADRGSKYTAITQIEDEVSKIRNDDWLTLE